METQEENKTTSLGCLENPNMDLALDNLKEKERLSIAMSSYYILYR